MENKKPFYKRKWFIAIAVFFLIGGIVNMFEDEEEVNEPINQVNQVQEDSQDQAQEEQLEVDEEDKVNLEVEGNVEVEFKDDKALVVVNTNAIDGSVFEISLLDSEFRTVSDFIPVKDGKAEKAFDVDKEWKPGYIGVVALMRFDLEDEPQPENVKEVYGENGEKLEGGLKKENVVEGYNIALETEPVPYPNEKIAKEVQDKAFDSAIKELKEVSGGVIIDVYPRLEENDWGVVSAVINDTWYTSAEHEKERFAEQLSETVETIIRNSGKVDSNESVMVYLVDSYNKDLATPKMFGGYKIKR